MKISKFNLLKKMLAAPYRISGITKCSKVHDFLVELRENGHAYTGYYRGHGWRTSATDYTNDVCFQLDKLGIAYETGNDAPRGGVHGNYVKIIMPAFLKEVKKERILREKEKEAALIALKKEQYEHQVWIEVELDRLGISREEITSIYIERMRGELPTTPKSYNVFTCKERRTVIWYLSQYHKGLNHKVLNHLLHDYQIVRF